MNRTLLVAALVLGVHAPVFAQDSGWQRLFPRVHYFPSLIADPMEPRMSLALLETNVFERAGEGREFRPPFTFPDPEDAASDVQVKAGIGGSIPLWRFAHWPGKGGVVASAQLGVFARFRIEYPTREDAGQDWFVGMPIEVAYDRFSGRFRIMHRSSHIGDELVQTTGAQRIEFGGEYADFLAAYELVDAVRLYSGATWNFRSYTEALPALVLRDRKDTAQLQAGFDASWLPWAGGRTGLVGGFDWQSQQRTNWRSQFAATGGFTVKTDNGAARLLARYFNGPSLMGEFFLTPERFWSVAWVVEF
ncbi:MAG: DUF1207 domain-containing protein [Gemmatimonadota bacterium]